MARPSPRTVGCAKRDPRTGECLEGQEFQRFGTSQLIKDPDAYMGVRAVVPPSVDPFGGMLKGVFGSPTVRNTAYPDLTITGAVESGLKQPLTPFEFPSNGNGEECDLGCLLTGRGCDCGCKDVKPCTTCDSTVCKECNAWDLQCEDCKKKDGTCTPPEECDLGCLLTGRGCDCGCKDVKPCTTCDSTVCKECNAWDLQCEDCKKKDGTCTPPLSEDCGCMPYDFGCEIGCWWEKNKNYVYLLGGLIGLGVLLWLLRPLFGFAKSVTEVSKSAVTKVNGLK